MTETLQLHFIVLFYLYKYIYIYIYSSLFQLFCSLLLFLFVILFFILFLSFHLFYFLYRIVKEGLEHNNFPASYDCRYAVHLTIKLLYSIKVNHNCAFTF